MKRNRSALSRKNGIVTIVGILIIVALSAVMITAAAASADLSATDNTTEPGEQATVTFELANTGSEASGYILDLSLPDGFEVVDTADAGGTWNAGETKWLWQTIEAGESTSPSVTLSVPADASGGYDIEGAVKTADGVATTANATVTVGAGSENEAPKAMLTANRSAVTVGDLVSLDATGSTDDGSIVEYRWDFDDDGQTDETTSGGSVVHTFSNAGDITPAVTVVDNDSATNTTRMSIAVEDETPPEEPDLLSIDTTLTEAGSQTTVAFNLTNTGTEPQAYILDLRLPGKFDIVGQSSDSGTWNAGETKWLYQTIETGALKSPSVTLSVPADASGGYEIEGSVKTADGIVTTANATVTVETGTENEVPEAVLTANQSTVTVGDPVSLDATGSTDDGSIVEYQWDFDDDGQPDQNTSDGTVVYNFSNAGEVTPTVTVVDNDSATNTTRTTITVEDETPPEGPDLLSIDTASTEAGSQTTVGFNLTNTGTEPQAYILDLRLPEEFDIVRQSSDGGTWNAGEVKWLYQTIETGASKSPSLTLSVPDSAQGRYSITAEIKTTDGVVTTRTANISVTDLTDSSIAPFSQTGAIDRSQVTPESLGGKLRVESAIAPDTTVELRQNTSTEYSLALTAPDTAENVSFYLQAQAISASQDVQNLTMYLDGEEHPFVVNESAGPGNSQWVAFNVPHFSTRTVTFSAENATLMLDAGSVAPNTVNESTTVSHDVGAVFENVSQDGNTDRFYITMPDAVAGSNISINDVNATDLADGGDLSITYSPELVDGPDEDAVMETVTFAVSPDATGTTDVMVNVSVDVTWPAVKANTSYDIRAAGNDSTTGSVTLTTVDEVTVTSEPDDVARIELSPASDQTITAGDTISFDATAFDGDGDVVKDDDGQFTWSAEGGSINATGFFDETTAGTYNVTAELDGITNTTTIIVEPGDVDRVELSPASDQMITAGDTIDFSATAFDAFDNPVEENDSQFTWNAEGGTISGAGLFEETTVGTYNVTAELGGVTNSTTVIVDPGDVARIELSPANDQIITAGETEDFFAAAYDSEDNLIETNDATFTWSAEGGSINATGFFEETTAGTYNVTAELDGITNTTTVTVEPAPVDRVELSPANDQTVITGGNIDFSATAFDAFDNIVEDNDSQFTWDAEDGSISATGLFEETSTGTYNVTAQLDGVMNTTTVTIEPGSVDRVELSPASNQTVTAGDTLEFSATAFDSNGNIVEDDDSQFTWDAEGGLINATGFLDETSAGIFKVTAELGGVTSDPTAVTIEPGNVDRVKVVPESDKTITAGETEDFFAVAYDSEGNRLAASDNDANFTWSAEGGSINATGFFNETTVGTYNVTAELDAVTSAPTEVTVEPDDIDSVEISPATNQTIAAGEAIDFSATAFDAFNNPVEDNDSQFSWDGEGGSINTTGFFDETTAGTYNVTAELGGVANTTTVTVEPGPVDRVELSPASDQTITAGDTLDFGATAFDAFDNVIETNDSQFTWGAENGSIGSSGVFEEDTPGSYSVTAELDTVTSNATVISVDTLCINRAVAGPGGEISLREIQSAINAWAEDQPLPDTGGEAISLPKIQELINAWAEDQSVACDA